MVPIERAGEGEVRICGDRVRSVADEHIHPIFVRRNPGWIKVSNHSGGVDEIAVVEVVVVVVGVAEIKAGVAGEVGADTDSTLPDSIVNERIDLLVVDKASKFSLQ